MQNGDFVKVSYIGRLESGEIFDLTDETEAKKNNIYNPNYRYGALPVIVGAGFVIPGLDKALMSMQPGEKKKVTVTPDEGFGQRDPKMVRVVPQNVFKERNVEPQQGMVVDFSGVKGRIQSVSGGRITVDFNNPMAGKTLEYDLEVVEKIDVAEQQIHAVLDYFGVSPQSVTVADDVTIEGVRLPMEIKERISYFIVRYVKKDKPVSRVKFVEVFEPKMKEASQEKQTV